jgi:mitochondrial import inner membrane translocase subunit TIM44
MIPTSRRLLTRCSVLQKNHVLGRYAGSGPWSTTVSFSSCLSEASSPSFTADISRSTACLQLPHKQLHVSSQRFFATQAKSSVEDESPTSKSAEKSGEEATSKSSEPESFEDTIKRMKGEDVDKSDSSSKMVDTDSIVRKAAEAWSTFAAEVGATWQELVRSGERKSINKKLHNAHPEATAEGDKPYTGPVDIMIIDPSEHLTAWERMQKRLTDAPIIQNILQQTQEIYEKSGAAEVHKRATHIREDAKEAWETSQNPWVYRISSVYDTLTAESAESVAVRSLRQLDPEFTLEDWRRDVVEHTLPQIMQWFLEGRINQLKDWLGEGVFKRMAAEMTARQQEGVEIDTHVLGIMNSEILACEMDDVNKGSPIIILHFMCQQINCVRKKEDGTIVEGSEDDIKANSYVAAFQREYLEETAELKWKIVDFRFNGAIAYL